MDGDGDVLEVDQLRRSLARLVVYRLHVGALGDELQDRQLEQDEDYSDVIDCLRGASMLLEFAGNRLGEIFDGR
jgi:hypothetical protein